jgi:hypothetical protein
LGHLRKQGYSEGAIYVHRAALRGFHQWRGESLVFSVRRRTHDCWTLQTLCRVHIMMAAPGESPGGRWSSSLWSTRSKRSSKSGPAADALLKPG